MINLEGKRDEELIIEERNDTCERDEGLPCGGDTCGWGFWMGSEVQSMRDVNRVVVIIHYY